MTTVAELREILSGLPDDLKIIINLHEPEYYEDNLHGYSDSESISVEIIHPNLITLDSDDRDVPYTFISNHDHTKTYGYVNHRTVSAVLLSCINNIKPLDN